MVVDLSERDHLSPEEVVGALQAPGYTEFNICTIVKVSRVCNTLVQCPYVVVTQGLAIWQYGLRRGVREMAQTYRHPAIEDVGLSEVLRALADPVRLRIVAVLLDKHEMTCAPMAAEIGISDSTLSHHLRLMREAGLTRTVVDGVQRRTTLRRAEVDRCFPGLLDLVAHTMAIERTAAGADVPMARSAP
jgi:DNA-binding transcriptional ArsR family regulator